MHTKVEGLVAAAELGDWPAAAQIIDDAWIDLTLSGHLDAIGRILAVMPDSHLRRTTTAGLLAENIGRLDAGAIAYELPSAASELGTLGRSTEAHRELLRSLAAMASRRRRGLHANAMEFAQRGAAIAEAAEFILAPDVESLLPFWHLQAGITAHLAGDDGFARRMHRSAYRKRHRSRFDIVGRDAAGNMALIEAHAGRLVEADAWLDRARAETHAPTWVGPMVDTAIVAAAGSVACDRLDAEGCREYVRTVAAEVDHDEHWASLLRIRVRIELTFGDVDTAAQVLEQSRSSHSKWTGAPGLGATSLAVSEAEVAMARGQGTLAQRAVDGVAPDDPAAAVVRTRLAVLMGDPEAADLLARLNIPDGALSLRDRSELLLLSAVASGRQQDRAEAAERLSAAVRMQRLHGSLRQFATVPRDFLRSMVSEVDGLADVLELLDAVGVRDVYPTSVRAVELTRSEHALLSRLDSGSPLPRLAQEMSVSVNTVRTHLAALRRKLHAHSREEVLANARRYGLLD
jgi:LuxR family maltose regulon positive regulatory protein